jgi:hypothetical protein
MLSPPIAADTTLCHVGDVEHRYQGDGEACCRRHRIGLGIGQGREHPPLLRLEREHGQKRQRDDQERKEQCRPHFYGRIADHPPLRGTGECLIRMRAMPCFDVLVRVLDHDHCRIHHGSDRDRDAAQGHDVRVHALVVHDDECHENAQGQRNDGDHGRAQMEQENEAHQRDDDEFFDQLLVQIAHGA